jgi:hypothetical protein
LWWEGSERGARREFEGRGLRVEEAVPEERVDQSQW